MTKHNVEFTIIEATCRQCGRAFKKKVAISPIDFEKSSDTMKHFIRGGKCSACRIKNKEEA